MKVLPEDVPETVARTLPGIAYLTELNLSPIDAPETARKFLSRSAAAIAKTMHGVILDPQADQVTLPLGRFPKSVLSCSAKLVHFAGASDAGRVRPRFSKQKGIAMRCEPA
ncbi:MAG: hypothetical protein WA642_03430 [Steroidobacteraceae bacterium]